MSNAPTTPAPSKALACRSKSNPTIAAGSRQRRLLSESITLEDERIPGFARTGLLLVGLLVLLFFAWITVVHLDELAIAPGEVVPSGAVKLVQHLEGGIVEEIVVEEGQVVQQGDVLVRLDRTQVQAELDQLRARQVSLQVRIERLKAFAEGRDLDFSGIPPEFIALVNDQERIFSSQVEAQRSGVQVLDMQVEQRKRELDQLGEALVVARRNAELTAELFMMRDELQRKGLVSRVLFLETSRAKVMADGEVIRLQEQIKVAAEALAEVEKRRTNLGDTLRQDALSEMGAAGAELAQIRNAIAKQEDRMSRMAITAPVDGLIQDLRVHAAGEVVLPGGMLMRVIPLAADLDVEVRISTTDIGHVAVGQPVKVKVSTYEFARYGSIPGVLSRISPTTFVVANEQPYYKGIVKLERSFMGPENGQFPALPGMVVQADIVTGSRTLLQYLLKPMFVALDSSFHQR